jgi:carbamoyltransferase
MLRLETEDYTWRAPADRDDRGRCIRLLNLIPEWWDRIPAVTHIDKSARYQSVTKDNNPRFHQIISSFYNKTGVPVLLNTSFNGPREPIVETPHDAIRALHNCYLNYLVIGNYVIVQNR